MPPASRALVRLALVHLLLGATLGSLLLVAKGEPRLSLLAWHWRAVHVEALVFGFVIQLVLGVAAWILPRDHDRRPGAAPAWLALALLNAGIGAACAGALVASPRWMLVGRGLESAAIVVFAIHAWPRIRGVRALPPMIAGRGAQHAQP